MYGVSIAALLLQLVSAPTGGEASVRGTVRSDATGAAIAGARVEIADPAVAAVADSAGVYSLLGIAAGPHQLRFVSPGYDTLLVNVLLAPDAQLSLDVALTRPPSTLAPVRVIARAEVDASAATTTTGGWQVSRKDIDETPSSDDADPFQLLATAPQAQVGVESQTSVHVRGGSADQNLFLLDGAPVYSPLHGAQTMSAFSPDIVDGLVLSGGAPSARYGGRLSSVIDVRTAAAVPSAVEVRGSLGSNAVRSAVNIPLVAGHAGLTLSGRHSYSGMVRDDAAERALPGAWSDGYGKLTLRLGTADVTMSSFVADNGLGFPASAASEQTESSPVLRIRNSFEWTTATQSAAWRQPLGARAVLETRVWRARFDGVANWESRDAPLVLGSRLHNGGGMSTLSVHHGAGTFTTGVEAERFDARYDVAPPPVGGTEAFHLRSAPMMMSAFAENEWKVGTAWAFDAGLRGTAVSGAAPRLEPRASATYRASSRLALSAGYARMHQYSQSLRNEESVIGTILGPDLLVAYGAAGVPVASSDELAASATITIDEHTRLDLDWYARALRGLVLVAPVTGEPFATNDFTVGTGHAWGASASLERRLDRLSLQSVWSLGEVTRRTATERYRPAFAPGQSASIAAAYRVGQHTRLRTAIWSSSGRFATPLGDDVGWDTRDAFTGARDFSGTPEHSAGPVGSSRLPNYLRVDIGVRHTMLLPRFGIALTGFADVNNALARQNVATYMTRGTEPPRPLVMLPSSVSVGLGWKY